MHHIEGLAPSATVGDLVSQLFIAIGGDESIQLRMVFGGRLLKNNDVPLTSLGITAGNTVMFAGITVSEALPASAACPRVVPSSQLQPLMDVEADGDLYS